MKRDNRRLSAWALLVLAAPAACDASAGNSDGGSGGSGSGSPSTGTGETSGTGASGTGASTGTGGKMYPPGPPGCGLASAAFCETFDAPATASTRAGELDPKRWSAARMCNIGGPTTNDEAVAIGLATVVGCRAGLPAQVPVNQDTLVCDGSDEIQSNHLVAAVAAQNYGQNSYRPRQPFDFAGRTGTIVFDADGYNEGLLGWISLEITEDPTPAPSFTLQQNWENGSIPANAVEIQLYNNCGGSNVGVGDILTYDNYAQASVFSMSQTCVPAMKGRLNHFEVRLSQDHVEVFATPFSDDGVTFAEPVLLASADLSLPFSRGYVHFTTHNHATIKYSPNHEMDAWVVPWDNLAFDGPVIAGALREHEALDALTPTADGRTNVAYRVADASTGPSQAITIQGVDLAGATSAKLALQTWHLHFAGETPDASYALNYRVNGGAWKAQKLTASEIAMMTALPNAGTRSLLLDVDMADLVPGTNQVEFTTTNANQGYPPVVLNLDLILETP